MLVILTEIDIDAGLGASKQLDNLLPLFVCLLPRVNKVENVVVWQFKPLNSRWVLAVSFHDSISCWLFLVKVENEFVLHTKIRS